MPSIPMVPPDNQAEARRNVLCHAKIVSVAGGLCNAIAALSRKMANEKCSDLDVSQPVALRRSQSVAPSAFARF